MATTVLLADDDRALVDALTPLLQTIGCSVVPAYSVREALDLLDTSPEINVVVSDIRMPFTDGFDLFRVLRHRFPSLPVVLMTGLPLTEGDVIPHGVTILEKPFRIEQLERVIVEVTERKRSSENQRDSV